MGRLLHRVSVSDRVHVDGIQLPRRDRVNASRVPIKSSRQQHARVAARISVMRTLITENHSNKTHKHTSMLYVF